MIDGNRGASIAMWMSHETPMPHTPCLNKQAALVFRDKELSL